MKSNPKIAFISEHASPLATLGGVDTGGQNVYVAQVARQLGARGYDVDVFTRWEDPSAPQVIEWVPGVRVVHVKAGPVQVVAKEDLLQYMPEFTRSVLAFIKSEKIRYDLTHANFFMSALVAADLKAILKIPFAVTFHALGRVRRIHQGDSDKFPKQRLQIEEDMVRKADYIIAECPQDRDDLISLYHAPAYKIVTVPCGFSHTEFYHVPKSLARRLLRVDESKHILLQLGRMVPRKGVDNVIRALSKLKNPESFCLLVVGGETDLPDTVQCPEIGRLLQIAKELGVEASVRFVGRKSREQLKYYYSAADIFITTPWYEPFGITPLESMACGTPVIGSNVGGIKYTVVDGETGALVPPENPEALAGRIEELTADKDLLEDMGKNALERVNAYFTWASVADKISDLYIRMLTETDSKKFVQTSLKSKSKAA
ncbi:glycosyltransferase family 1 protein [Mucilaginibacter sp. RS28]|uniref:Glycosyltransferase family 1 protein n=1 Tax=Mucilaginibacter straminoryzae TaxID=2932774 RepID=A0A9X1X1P0_9SPHI|nr:glycosyltransferase family 1 protein [Mucilaginibacter straminoryzae]MCJ8208685.1 glycosyltransferase family 1 protein [Mucilaginibacter straminoryzae]